MRTLAEIAREARRRKRGVFRCSACREVKDDHDLAYMDEGVYPVCVQCADRERPVWDD